jgi:DNA excision repair protein ERCC-1
VDVLSSAKSFNKTDLAQLLSQFGSLKVVIAASMDELCLCPGMGEKGLLLTS